LPNAQLFELACDRDGAELCQELEELQLLSAGARDEPPRWRRLAEAGGDEPFDGAGRLEQPRAERDVGRRLAGRGRRVDLKLEHLCDVSKRGMRVSKRCAVSWCSAKARASCSSRAAPDSARFTVSSGKLTQPIHVQARRQLEAPGVGATEPLRQVDDVALDPLICAKMRGATSISTSDKSRTLP